MVNTILMFLHARIVCQPQKKTISFTRGSLKRTRFDVKGRTKD